MMVADGVDVRPGVVDRAVDHALRIKRDVAGWDRLRRQIELQNIRVSNELRRQRARQIKAGRIGGVPHAHVAEGIQNVLVREDAVGGCQ
jgi:hypothetical protein